MWTKPMLGSFLACRDNIFFILQLCNSSENDYLSKNPEIIFSINRSVKHPKNVHLNILEHKMTSLTVLNCIKIKRILDLRSRRANPDPREPWTLLDQPHQMLEG